MMANPQRNQSTRDELRTTIPKTGFYQSRGRAQRDNSTGSTAKGDRSVARRQAERAMSRVFILAPVATFLTRVPQSSIATASPWAGAGSGWHLLPNAAQMRETWSCRILSIALERSFQY